MPDIKQEIIAVINLIIGVIAAGISFICVAIMVEHGAQWKPFCTLIVCNTLAVFMAGKVVRFLGKEFRNEN